MYDDKGQGPSPDQAAPLSACMPPHRWPPGRRALLLTAELRKYATHGCRLLERGLEFLAVGQ